MEKALLQRGAEYMKKKVELTEQEATVLNILEGLGINERIKGDRLQVLARIKTKRELFAVISSLREKCFAIGASKKLENGGYFIIRTEAQLLEWKEQTFKGARKEMSIVEGVVEHWRKEHSEKGGLTSNANC